MNTLKVGFLLVALTAVLIWIGNIAGGQSGMIVALVIAAVMNIGSYWFSDKIVLAMTRAQPLDPSQAPRLYAIVQDLCQRAGLPMPRLYIVPDRSPNAFATGRNPEHAVVAVNQGLLDILDESEIKGVLAHELSHVKHRDTLTMSIVATVAGAVMVLSNMLRFAAFFGGFGGRDDDRNPIAALIAALVAPVAAMLIQMGISRTREFEADRLGAELAGTGRGLQSALVKLDRGVSMRPGKMPPQAAHMCIVNPFSGLNGVAKLFSTHPSVEERIQRLQELEPQLSGRTATAH